VPDAVGSNLADVQRRIAAIEALLDATPAGSRPAEGAAAGAGDFGRALATALSQPGAGVAATVVAASPSPPVTGVPAGYALVPLSALGLGGGQPPAASELRAVPAATGEGISTPASPAATPVPASVIPAPSARAAQRVALAAAEIGVVEAPPGSNDGPRIAEYRTATAGAGVGPWCAYFTSWIGAQAGTPLGERGEGEGYVPHMADWLRGEGRYASPSDATPRPGDLVFFDWERDGELDHIGLVHAVGADGRVYTIEGNADNAVKQRSWSSAEIAGYGLLP
jgi:hypothetical protein